MTDFVEPYKLALIGGDVSASHSDQIHSNFLQRMEINASYDKYSVAKGRLASFLESAEKTHLGLSVTMPLKQTVIELLDHLEPEAHSLGAVNTILFKEGKRYGTNTDGVGALRALSKNIDVKNKNVLLVGAGGAARGIAHTLKPLVKEIIIVNRGKQAGRNLAIELDAEYLPLESYQQNAPQNMDIVIQTTSVGMDNTSTLLTGQSLANTPLVMDIISKPELTPSIQLAKSMGCETIPGIEMWLHQALLQYEYWFQGRVPIKLETLRQAYQSVIGQ